MIWELPPETGYDLASSLLREHPDVDGVYMPCNKWRTVSAIARIEKDTGKPVVTNTQAWTWSARKSTGMGDHHRLWPSLGSRELNLEHPSIEQLVDNIF